jgi:hypothetical protein
VEQNVVISFLIEEHYHTVQRLKIAWYTRKKVSNMHFTAEPETNPILYTAYKISRDHVHLLPFLTPADLLANV